MIELADLLDTPFYTSTVATPSASILGQWHVGLAGVGYMLDLQLIENLSRVTDAFQHESIPLVRQQADTSNEPGEQSINPADLWRRSAEEWGNGAGQNYYDRNFSTTGRYRASSGIDPSTFGQISLLPDTDVVLASTNTNMQLAVAGVDLYTLDGAAVKSTASLAFPATWTTITGLAGTPTSLCSDGHRVYIATPTNLFYTDRGSSSMSAFHSATFADQTLARYVKGRLLTTAGPIVYDNGAQGSAVPAALYTQPNSDWKWVDIAEGPNAIYFAGFSGDKSLIYSTGIKTDATALDAPVVAGELPDGEIVRSIQGYLGFLMIGSDKGVRFGNLDTTGALSTIGDLIPTDDPVLGFEPQDRFVWYCGTTNDGGSSLGRADLRFLNGTAPAYWNDLAVPDAHVPATSVVTYEGKRVFSTLQGIYAENQNRVASGTLTSGYIGYNLPDDKTALQIITKTGPGAGFYTVAVSVDDSDAVPLGPPIETQPSSGGGSILATNLRGTLFEVTLTLMRSLDDPTSGPQLRRWTLRSSPAAQRRRTIVVPLLLHQTVSDLSGHDRTFDPLAEVENIAALANSGQVTTYQEMDRAFQVIVEDYHWVPHQLDPKKNWGGTVSVHLGTV